MSKVSILVASFMNKIRLNLLNKSQIEGRVKQSPREAMLIKQAEVERDSENRADK